MPVKTCEPYEKLPTNVVPTHYDLYLKPDLQKCIFEGKVTVSLKVNSVAHHVKFHSIELELGDVNLQTEDGASVPINTNTCEQNESVILDVLQEGGLQQGSYKLSMNFKGVLGDNLRGFYRAKYLSPEGEERFCAITQFEASKAHRCFPCWDEPAFKATFDISVCVAKDRVALSNMPVLSEEENGDGSRVLRFSTSAIMSTYLVAVVVGEFDFIEQSTPDGVKVRVYTPLNKQEQGKFALDVAVKVLPYFEDFFKIPYPLPKMDLIAVPSLSFGAMENWGLITYRESCLLVDPKNSSTRKIQSIALVVAHEIAHQWFGNLVTMEWWDHLWLNEGYATFMEFLSVGKLFPEFKIWNQFITMTYSPAMKLDSLQTSHPVEVHVNHPLHVDEVFDDISYNKGASLIRMLHGYIGNDDFEKGLNMYLTKFQYKNASTNDLWNVLEEASQKPISSIMPKWTTVSGYPAISVKREQDGNSCKLFLKQFKFCASGNQKDDETWIVPVEYSTKKSKGETISRFVLDSKELTITVDGVDENEWIKLNPGIIGFYRVQYSPDMLETLLPAISNLSLPPMDRLGLLDDLFALVQAGYTKSDKILELLLAMSHEDTCMVWSTIGGVVMRLKKLVDYTDCSTRDSFMAFGRCLLKHIRGKVTWDPQPNESHEDKLLRSLILDLLGEFEDKATVMEAEKRLMAHLDGSSILLPDLRVVVYSKGVKNADLQLYNSVLELYRGATLQEEKERILYSLTAMKDEALIGQFLKFALSDDVRKESALQILSAISQSRAGREQVWDYTKQHWNNLVERFAGTFALPRFISAVFASAASSDMANQVELFSKSHNVLGMERTMDQAVEKIRVNAAWLERDSQVIKSFLKTYE